MGFRTKDDVDLGSKASNFTLPSQSGELVSFRDFLGEKPVIMVFQRYKEQISELRFRALLSKDGTRQIELVSA